MEKASKQYSQNQRKVDNKRGYILDIIPDMYNHWKQLR